MNVARPRTVSSSEARRKTPALTRRDVACQIAGGVGAVTSCAGMIASLVAGLLGGVGAAGGSLATRGGMSGMSMPGPKQPLAAANPALTVLNHIAIPLLLVSIVLTLAGVARAGWRALAWVAAGSALLLAAMLPTSPQVVAWLLIAGFLLVISGYVSAWNQARAHHAVPARS